MRSIKKEYLYAGISIFLWATLATVAKILLSSLGNMQVLAVSSLFAFVFLLVLNLVKGNLAVLKTYSIKDYLQIARIGCLGVVIVTTNGKLSAIDSGSLVGALFCVLAAVSYGLFSVLNKLKNYDKSVSIMLYYGVCLVISAVCLPFSGPLSPMNLPQILGLAWNGIFVNAIAFVTWAMAMERGDTAKISNLAYITPFLSLVWTFFLLKEPFSIYSVLGLIVIIAGILIQVSKKSNTK